MGFTRGFTGRGASERDPRLPPGQYDTRGQFPVLTAEVTPQIDPATFTFTVEGEVEQPTTWTLDERRALPGPPYGGDTPGVTTGSLPDTSFAGVSVDALPAAAKPTPAATHVVAWSHSGYTTNLPLDDVV